MPHHGHLVQRGLPVEDDDVTVTHVALHLGAPRNPNLQSDPYRGTPKPHSRSHMGSHQNPIGGAIWGHPDPRTSRQPHRDTPTYRQTHMGPPQHPDTAVRPTWRPQNPIAGPIWGHPNTADRPIWRPQNPNLQSDTYGVTPKPHSRSHMGSPRHPNTAVRSIWGHPKTPEAEPYGDTPTPRHTVRHIRGHPKTP